MDWVYFKGGIIQSNNANISIKTNSFHYGTAIFEGIRAYYNPENNKMYGLFFEEHYVRLLKNTKILFMEIKEAVNELVDITIELIKKNNYKEDVYIRPIVYFSDLAISPKLLNYKAEIAIYTVPLGDYIDTKNGIKAKVSSWIRLNENVIPPRLKVSGAYVNSALAKTEAMLCGCDEAIVLNQDGYVAEGSAENIFIVKNKKLITPPTSSDILEGITRKAVIEIANYLEINVEEKNISRTELYQADEVFLCGTGAQISPVIEIDNRKIREGKVGQLTEKIKDIYFKAVRGQLSSFRHWIIEI